MPDPLPPTIFVYGTLKRGGSRERCWPHPPRRVEPAYVPGQLYDLGAYPGFMPGPGVVGGELWFCRLQDVEATLRVLDAIEGYAQGGPDLYVRELIFCRTARGKQYTAHIYRYAQPITCPPHRPIPGNAAGIAEWTAGWPAQS